MNELAGLHKWPNRKMKTDDTEDFFYHLDQDQYQAQKEHEQQREKCEHCHKPFNKKGEPNCRCEEVD